MGPDRWRQIDEILDEALDLPEGERGRFIDSRCAGDDDLRKEVLELLAAGSGAGEFLENSAMGIAARNLAQEKSAAVDLIDRKIGRFNIERQIGTGGMGDVFLAFDEHLKRPVALKILPAEFTSNDERVMRFELEARAISALNHPNIVTIFDVGNTDGVNFIATEFVEGKTLREIVGEHRSILEILGIIIQVSDALAAAHDAGIIHRDIKPENIMVRPDGYVKVLDFGLAKLNGSGFSTLRNFTGTAKGIIIGTPAYMSPEQVADENVDHRTDLWSVGVVLYELVTGVNPFRKESRQATFEAILTRSPPRASELNEDAAPELDRVLVKALEKDADRSYQSAADLRNDLASIRRDLDSSASIRTEPAGTAPRRRVSVLMIATALIAVAVGLTAFVALRFRDAAGAQPSEAREWLRARHSQVTETAFQEGYPSISPDGREVIFAGGPISNRDIFQQRLGGRSARNLTESHTGSDTMPAYSPDGRFIAFRSERDGGGIFVMEQTGENVRRIADFGFHPAWSPDGAKIFVSERAAAIHTVHTLPNSRLWEIDIATGEKRLIEAGGDAMMPSVSPNGKRVAFWFVADGKLPGIATVPVGGGTPIVVAEHEGSDWNPVWSPDGRHLYFASDRGGSMNFWRIPIDETSGVADGEPESITTPAKYPRHISISRDGRVLAYVRYESQSNIHAIDFDSKTLKTVGDPRFITSGDRELGNPVLSPDGNLIVARNPQRTKEDLVVFDVAGENWRYLTDDLSRERLPRWMPDGKSVVFASDRTGAYQIWSARVDRPETTQLTFLKEGAAVAPVISPDGSKLAFTVAADSKQSARIINLAVPYDNQTPVAISSEPNGVSYTVRDWSPDGKKLLVVYFEHDGDENGTGVVDLATGIFRQLTKTGTSPFWLADNRHYIFVDRGAVFVCDSSTGTTSQIYRPTKYEVQQAFPTPDNRMILFRYLQVDADIWLLESESPR